MFNMFIMKKDRFNEYASWIFDVLSELSKRINIDDYSIQEARVYGYIAELLMDVWIEATDTYFVEQSYFQVGKKHMAKKLFFS